MLYKIHHTTAFRYDQPIRESVMEVRMKPRSEASQRCHEFNLKTSPAARTHSYTDYLGNVVQHFDIPSVHDHLEVTAVALVETYANGASPPAGEASAWNQLDALAGSAEHWDWLHPSYFAKPSDPLSAFAERAGLRRESDPLTVLNKTREALHAAIRYDRGATRVDSPIDECLEKKSGVCQDFAHVFIALARGLGIPARYVSGYLFHREGDAEPAAGAATHAWAEAFIPGVGWMGFDPSNNCAVGERHIRVAIGRDYKDVPPNRGVFKGIANQSLDVHVDVARA
ncbi:MAG TPA: transglutaminase family protein [Phycisphaerae bacterium]|nr:transglutaminase family protein [Phycisphaerae bacterium]